MSIVLKQPVCSFRRTNVSKIASGDKFSVATLTQIIVIASRSTEMSRLEGVNIMLRSLVKNIKLCLASLASFDSHLYVGSYLTIHTHCGCVWAKTGRYFQLSPHSEKPLS